MTEEELLAYQEYLRQLEEERKRKYRALREGLVGIKGQLNTLKGNLKSLESNPEQIACTFKLYEKIRKQTLF